MAREKYQIIHLAFTTSWRFAMDTTGMVPDSQRSPVDPTLFADLPALPGIYRFFGEQDELLYVGKSINLRQRAKSHFSARHRDKKEGRLCYLTRRIEHQVTAGELGALLLENREIKQRQPIFNRRQRRYRQLHTWRLETDARGFLVPVLYRPLANNDGWHQDSYGLFRSPRQAKAMLDSKVRDAGLCPRICGLEGSGKGACFAHQLGRCRGACCGKETVESHDQRLRATLEDQHIQAWPYTGVLVIREENGQQTDYHLIDQWCHLTTVQREPETAAVMPDTDASFDLDSYRMLIRFLNQGIEHFVLAPDN
ncbi:GIY-YIG nuclease family protein [uncultured Alcanivorax sp.]|uniref:GIY-YIG nuclease family protein n=1 Tax=uncultured Alcanivorax sp. TaxID=191215 RepID=UPI0026221053|nr:GIY-YIG nuclease family protein [uncultured Alcanivorax sp.]